VGEAEEDDAIAAPGMLRSSVDDVEDVLNREASSVGVVEGTVDGVIDAKHETTVVVTTNVTVTVSGAGMPGVDVGNEEVGVVELDADDETVAPSGAIGGVETRGPGVNAEEVEVGVEVDVDVDVGDGEMNGIGKPVLEVVAADALSY